MRTQLLEALVFAAGAGDVRHVIAGGQARSSSDGRHLGVDVAAELREAIGAVTP